MIGAIIGDIIGSIYEFNNIRTKEFSFFTPHMFFTDDTVLTIAVYEALYRCRGNYKKLEKQTLGKCKCMENNIQIAAGYPMAETL